MRRYSPWIEPEEELSRKLVNFLKWLKERLPYRFWFFLYWLSQPIFRILLLFDSVKVFLRAFMAELRKRLK